MQYQVTCLTRNKVNNKIIGYLLQYQNGTVAGRVRYLSATQLKERRE